MATLSMVSCAPPSASVDVSLIGQSSADVTSFMDDVADAATIFIDSNQSSSSSASSHESLSSSEQSKSSSDRYEENKLGNGWIQLGTADNGKQQSLSSVSAQCISVIVDSDHSIDDDEDGDDDDVFRKDDNGYGVHAATLPPSGAKLGLHHRSMCKSSDNFELSRRSSDQSETNNKLNVTTTKLRKEYRSSGDITDIPKIDVSSFGAIANSSRRSEQTLASSTDGDGFSTASTALLLSPVKNFGRSAGRTECRVPRSLNLSPCKDLGNCIHSSAEYHNASSPCPWYRNYNTTPLGPRFTLLKEGDLPLCHLDHQKTIISKILSSKFLRRWEVHHLYLNDTVLASKTPTGFMETPIKYTDIQDICLITRWDNGGRYFLRISISNGCSYLFQISVPHARDQWFHSILWKKNMLRYKTVLKATTKKDVILQELANMVEFVTKTPLHDAEVTRMPISIISKLLADLLKHKEDVLLNKKWAQLFISYITPLLDNCPPTYEVCQLFSHHCEHFPKSAVIKDSLCLSVSHILKHNVDFGKYPYMRKLVIDYIKSLGCQHNGNELLCNFISSVHGENYDCPHPRVLPNLVAVCVSALFSTFESDSTAHKIESLSPASLSPNPSLLSLNQSPTNLLSPSQSSNNLLSPDDTESTNDSLFEETNSNNMEENDELNISSDDESFVDSTDHYKYYLNVLIHISRFPDWIPVMSQLLQPVPFPKSALDCPDFLNDMSIVMENICAHHSCDVHQMILPIRKEKESWFDIYSPISSRCQDEGLLWASMLERLLNCCCKRKSFINELTGKRLEAVMLMALRDYSAAQSALCLMLEWQLIDKFDQAVQISTTLQSTKSGLSKYDKLCQKQLHLQKFQLKLGPTKLTLPCRSVDKDFFSLMTGGPFGNLEDLTLAFTHVTSACADILIKLPSLKNLNLWATQFDDQGLLMISEHLTNLESLNLCETPVTDRGIIALTALKKLKSLNLNSTKLSTTMYLILRNELPKDCSIDIRYTGAWYIPPPVTQNKANSS